jgi:hypothetical protein
MKLALCLLALLAGEAAGTQQTSSSSRRIVVAALPLCASSSPQDA